MALAPIRGAPPCAPIPDFPTDEPRKPAQPAAIPASKEQPPTPPVRQSHTPIEIGAGGVTFIFKVIPEQPAIARASLTIHIVAESAGSIPSHKVGFLQMSASNARRFLTDLRNDRFPIVATGDEEGDVQIEYENTGAGPALIVRKPSDTEAIYRSIIGVGCDLQARANELLADLGA
jgi:hypothetical protein